MLHGDQQVTMLLYEPECPKTKRTLVERGLQANFDSGYQCKLIQKIPATRFLLFITVSLCKPLAHFRIDENMSLSQPLSHRRESSVACARGTVTNAVSHQRGTNQYRWTCPSLARLPPLSEPAPRKHGVRSCLTPALRTSLPPTHPAAVAGTRFLSSETRT